ncbi:MAG: amidohydrolase [Anaerovoracaceae bacterium]|jgi:predicted amidohydrolase YtcJ
MTTTLINAKIYTMDEAAPRARMLSYEGKYITAVDGEAAGGAVDGQAAGGRVIDLGGRTVIPGIIDSHIHPGWCGKSAWHVRLPWTFDREELLAFVRDYAANHPKEEAPFIYFEYYPTAMFDANGPTKELLDTAVSDRPVLCQDFGEHLCWVNSAMLDALEVDQDTPDPSTLEVFVRDEEGNPTGWIKEMAWRHFAENLFRNIDWMPPDKLDEAALRPVFDFLTDSGITAMCDGFIEDEEQIRTTYELDCAGKLNCYYDGMVRFQNYAELPEKIALLREYDRKYATGHIKFSTMKLFLDGTNESGNSASLSEHIHDPGNYGEIMMETDELTKCFLLCNREGLDLHIHMVGDRAFRVGCDAVEAAQKQAARDGQAWTCQPVFAHCEVVDPADMPRPAQLGITVNWSCHWSGGYFGEEAMNYYSEGKWRRMYRFNEFIQSGALVTFSSDVVTMYELHRADPFFSMQVAATRVDPEFPLDPQRYPGSMRPQKDARLTVPDLMKGYTIGGARQLHWKDKMGSLEKGKLANLLVLSRDPYEVPKEELSDIRVEAVIFDGRVVRGAL